MSEMFSERPIGANELSEMVFGPVADPQGQNILPAQLFADGMRAYEQARDRRDNDAKIQAEQYLSGLLDTYPALRQQFVSED